MGNCLVTNLKGVVDNAALKKYGEWEFTLPSSGGEVKTMDGMYLYSPTMRIIGGAGYFCDAQGASLGQEITIGISTFYYKSTTDLTIAVNHKYEHPQSGEGFINKDFHVHTDEIKYKQFVDFSATISGPLSNIDATREITVRTEAGRVFSPSDMTSFLRNCCGKNVCINLWGGVCNINTSLFSELAQYGLNTVEIRLYLCSGLSGELKNFGYFKVTDLYLSDAPAASMTGTLEDFIDLLLVNNPSGGKFKFASPERYRNVTYKGESLSTQVEVLKQDSSYINYDAQGNITWTAS